LQYFVLLQYYNQAKCWKRWRNVMCGGWILSCCPSNLHRHERALKEEEDNTIILSSSICFLITFFYLYFLLLCKNDEGSAVHSTLSISFKLL